MSTVSCPWIPVPCNLQYSMGMADWDERAQNTSRIVGDVCSPMIEPNPPLRKEQLFGCFGAQEGIRDGANDPTHYAAVRLRRTPHAILLDGRGVPALLFIAADTVGVRSIRLRTRD